MTLPAPSRQHTSTASLAACLLLAVLTGCDFDDPPDSPPSTSAGPPSIEPRREPKDQTVAPIASVLDGPEEANWALQPEPVDTTFPSADAPSGEVSIAPSPIASSGENATNVGPVAPGSQNAPLEGSPARCPKGTLEVRGDYCQEVMHRCVRGGKTHTGEATGEPEPFYCTQYQPGFAQCLGRVKTMNFCIDEFEYPNELGEIPRVMVTWFEARRLCEEQQKRLCGDDEWTLACEGPERLPFPYGYARDKSACNIDHRWVEPNDGLLASKTAKPSDVEAEVVRLSKRVPAGSMPRCKSGYGVMDMAGNVDEWAVNVTLAGKPYQSVFKGGHWVSGARNRCRPVTASHDETTAYYAEGFRCCANILGANATKQP